MTGFPQTFRATDPKRTSIDPKISPPYRFLFQTQALNRFKVPAIGEIIVMIKNKSKSLTWHLKVLTNRENPEGWDAKQMLQSVWRWHERVLKTKHYLMVKPASVRTEGPYGYQTFETQHEFVSWVDEFLHLHCWTTLKQHVKRLK